MTPIASANPLTQMLDNAFSKVDRNKDGKLDAGEFQAFNEILKPGLPVDQNGKPLVDEQKVMDKNGDGEVSKDEMEHTTVLMPAALTDPSLNAMFDYLSKQNTAQDSAVAALLRQPDDVKLQNA